ncbi:MAG: carbohydrate kinase family protein [Bacilli bacterium]|nr:carbohydrate kinase family protein [Bacilli bacterium]
MIYIVGGANVDVFISSYENIILNNSNPASESKGYGGVARNICENLARLKEEIKFISVVGDDEEGKRILNDLEELGVDASYCIVSKKYPTSKYYAFLDKNKDMYVAMICMDILEELSYNNLSFLEKVVNEDDILVLDTNFKEEIINKLLTRVKGTKILDPISQSKIKKIRNNLAFIDVLKPNIYELEELIGTKITNQEIFLNACAQIHQMGVKHLFVTLNKYGAFYYGDAGRFYLNGEDVTVVNATGAGDAFSAGLAYGFNHHLKIEEILKLANKMACETLKVDSAVNSQIGGIKNEY